MRCSIFFCTSDEKHSDIEEVYKTYINRLPEKCIPIADLDCGNLICISLCDENYRKMYFGDHEVMDTDEGEECTLRFDDMELIAELFDELCEKYNLRPMQILFKSIHRGRLNGMNLFRGYAHYGVSYNIQENLGFHSVLFVLMPAEHSIVSEIDERHSYLADTKRGYTVCNAQLYDIIIQRR